MIPFGMLATLIDAVRKLAVPPEFFLPICEL